MAIKIFQEDSRKRNCIKENEKMKGFISYIIFEHDF